MTENDKQAIEKAMFLLDGLAKIFSEHATHVPPERKVIACFLALVLTTVWGKENASLNITAELIAERCNIPIEIAETVVSEINEFNELGIEDAETFLDKMKGILGQGGEA